MDESLRAHVDAHLQQLQSLIARGRRMTDAEFRVWLQDCAAAVNQLAGGSKAHWLARAYSDAFLDRSTIGAGTGSSPPREIAARVISVLEQGRASLSRMGTTEDEASDHEYPGRAGGGPTLAVDRSFSFGFVHHARLRPVLAQAYVESRVSFRTGDYRRALQTTCGIIEAIVTDALEHKQLSTGEISRWSFDERLIAAQAAGLIRGGAARLPAVARAYREKDVVADVTERDATRTHQVLHVLMKDLDPGR